MAAEFLREAGPDQARQFGEALIELTGGPAPPKDEEALRTEVTGLGHRAVQIAHEILEYGAPGARLSLLRALLAPMLGGVRADEDAVRRAADLREQFDGIMEAVKDGARAAGPPAEDPDERERA